MSNFVAIIVGLVVIGVLFKLFRKQMLMVAGVAAVVLAICVVWPKALVVVADLVIRIRDILGMK